MIDEKPYVYDDAAQKRVAAELARIDAEQRGYPMCALCGQRARKLDRFGLCSKESDPHRDWSARGRAEMRAGAR